MQMRDPFCLLHVVQLHMRALCTACGPRVANEPAVRTGRSFLCCGIAAIHNAALYMMGTKLLTGLKATSCRRSAALILCPIACSAAPEDVKWAPKRAAHVVLAGRRSQFVPLPARGAPCISFFEFIL